MKRLFNVLMVIVLALCLFGCDSNPNVEDSQEDTHIEFWTDKETGVQYVIYDKGAGYAGMGGITPRLNTDGTLYHPTEKGGASDAD